MSLIDTLKKYDSLYYNTGDSPITDTEYDLLRSKAMKEFPNDPYFTKIGSVIEGKFEKIILPFVMGGLDEYNKETVSSWIEEVDDDIVASEKLDGNSVGVEFENGFLSFAASRGDGIEGQNLINKIKYSIPSLKKLQKISLRGEVLLKGELYKEFGMKNRRNSVTGILRRDNIIPDNLKKLSVIFYELVDEKVKTEIERIQFIKDLGLETARFMTIPKNLPTEKKIEVLESFLIHVKETANYDIDGLVLTRNNSIRENVLHPKNKVKFKVNQEAVKCSVIGVEWNVTRIGYVKPVVLINPTEIMGTTIGRCSGFNYDFINSNGIGIGSEVGVVRSGDVIPYITEVFKKIDNVVIPTSCPSCGSVLEKTDKELICIDNECTQKLYFGISHYFNMMGAEGIKNKTVENIKITSLFKYYELTEKDIEPIPGFGKKSAKEIIQEIKKTLKVKPEQFLAALGIPLIGRTLSKQLCSKYSIDELFLIKDPNKLGIGDITSKTLIENLPKYLTLYEFLKEKGLTFIEDDPNSKKLKGMKFALTGEGPMKRSEIQKLIEAKGGEVSGVSKNTTFLVTSEEDSKSNKMKSAEKLGVKVINYQKLFSEFLKGD